MCLSSFSSFFFFFRGGLGPHLVMLLKNQFWSSKCFFFLLFVGHSSSYHIQVMDAFKSTKKENQVSFAIVKVTLLL